MDINDYINTLNATTEEVLQLSGSLPADLLHYKKDSAWSLMEILEHICKVERVCAAIVSRPSDTRAEHAEKMGDDKLRHIMVNKRHVKAESPDILKPKGELKDIAAFEQSFTSQREQLKQQLLNGSIVPDNRVNKHPFLGEMTYVDWLYFMVRHTERHIEQIREKVESDAASKG